jgi:hypothetical protein
MGAGVELKRYEKSELVHINRWLKLRSLPEVIDSDLPEYGYIVHVNDVPVGAGFLRRCEGNIALIDSMITNPESSKAVRHEALDCIANNLISAANLMDIKALNCLTIDSSIMDRAKRHGFKETNFIPMSLKLGEP